MGGYFMKDKEMSNQEFNTIFLVDSSQSEQINKAINNTINRLNLLLTNNNQINYLKQSNLCLAFFELNKILRKESQGGQMPDFGGVIPLILLIIDRDCSNGKYIDELRLLKNKPWFKVALKYCIIIEANNLHNIKDLRDFVSSNGEFVRTNNIDLLESIIETIIITALKSELISDITDNQKYINVIYSIRQEVSEALELIDE